MSLCAEDVRFFRENGYLALPRFLSEEALTRGRRIIDEYLEQSRDLTESNAVLDVERDHNRDNPRLRRIKNAADVHPFFGSIMRDPVILDIVEELLRTGVRFRRSQLNIKTPGGGTPVEWHQDFAFEPHTNPDILSIGVALDDSSTETGCLYVIPGSHRRGVFDHWEGDEFVGAVSLDSPNIDFASATPVELEAGGIWVHHGLVLHGSGPNKTNRHARSALLLDYSAADAWPLYTPVSDLEDYEMRVVRGEWRGQVRLTNMSFRVPPLSTSQVTTYDVQSAVRVSGFA